MWLRGGWLVAIGLAAHPALAQQRPGDDPAAHEAACEGFRTRFETLGRQEGVPILTAIRGQVFSEAPREHIVIREQDGAVEIRKPGGPECYHVCPDFLVEPGFRAALKFRLTEPGRRGGTPVPYFGVRDEEGREETLLLFSSFPDPEEVFEILIERREEEIVVLYGGRFVVSQPLVLGERVRMFFHLNDTSAVILEELRTDFGSGGGSDGL